MKVEVRVNKDKIIKGFPETVIIIKELDIKQTLDISFKKLYRRCKHKSTITLDFLFIASVCYVIDKSISREHAIDNWTRKLDVKIPVLNQDIWLDNKDHFEDTLNFLTGDIWHFTFIALDSPLPQPITRQLQRKSSNYRLLNQPKSVCLFSGGLDSLIGSINLLAASAKSSVLLVGHYDAPGAKLPQKILFRPIWDKYQKYVELIQVRVAHKPIEGYELTLRSRSLVFIALGVYVANSFGDNIPVYCPENGLIALNIPLTPSRVGSCSTRTMHPYFLSKVTGLLQNFGIKNEIINPFRFKTKGECLSECIDTVLLKELIDKSVSCSHASRRQNWIRRKANNCGYCIPCIIRRASLHSVGWDNGKKYGIDVLKKEIKSTDKTKSANDLRAIQDFIFNGYDRKKLSSEIQNIAKINNISNYTELAERGFDEVKNFLRKNRYEL